MTEFHITVVLGHESVQEVVTATHRALVTGLEVQTGHKVSIDHKVPDLTKITGTGVKIGTVIAGVGVITKTVIKAWKKEIIGSDVAFYSGKFTYKFKSLFHTFFLFFLYKPLRTMNGHHSAYD